MKPVECMIRIAMSFRESPEVVKLPWTPHVCNSWRHAELTAFVLVGFHPYKTINDVDCDRGLL